MPETSQKFPLPATLPSLARWYLLVGLTAGLLGGFTALLFRLSQRFDILAAPAYQLAVTLHASFLQLWLAPALLLGTLGSLTLSAGSQAPRIPPFAMRLALPLFLVSLLMALAIALLPGGESALPARAAFGFFPSAAAWWVSAVALNFASFLLFGTGLAWSLKHSASRYLLPLAASAAMASSLLFSAVAAPQVLRAFELLGSGRLSAPPPGVVPLWRGLFPYFGQPLLCIALLPALGMVAEVIAQHSGRALRGQRLVIASFFGAAFATFLVWIFHQSAVWYNPDPTYLRRISYLTTLVFTVPALAVLIACAASYRPSRESASPALLFSLGFLAELLLGGVTGALLNVPTIRQRVHDTYFVTAHFHFMLASVALLAVFSGLYFHFRTLFGSEPHPKLGRIHFFGTFVSLNAVFLPLLYAGAQGDQRRRSLYSAISASGAADLSGLRNFSTLSFTALLLFQLPFLALLFRAAQTMFSRRAAKG